MKTTPMHYLTLLLGFSVTKYTWGFIRVDVNWLTDNYVQTINEQSKGRWKASRNAFDKFTDEQLLVLGGLKAYHPDPKFKPYTKRYDNINRTKIPPSFDARQHWPQCGSIGVVRDQRYCGASWDFAAAEVMSDRICVASQGMIEFTFSVEELIACCESCGNGCTSGYLYTPFEYWRIYGIPSGGDQYRSELLYNSTANELSKLTKGDLIDIIVTKEVPCTINVSKTTKEIIEKGNYKYNYLHQGCKPFTASNGVNPVCSPHCTLGYNKSLESDRRHGLAAYHVHPDVAQIQTEILTNGPVVAAIDLYKDYFAYKEGIYEHTSWELVGRHAVKIIGWGVENGVPYWLLMNSWGAEFGVEGVSKIQRGVNQCGIEYSVTGGVPNVME